MKKWNLIIGCLMIAIAAAAQDYVSDPVRFLRPDLGGTARSQGVGGAFSSVGADMSALSSNPAGLGLYRSNDVSLGMGATFGTTSTSYLNTGSEGSFSKFNFNHIGIVITTRDLAATNRNPHTGYHGLSRVVFGINYQKVADFDRTINFTGNNNSNSINYAYANIINQVTGGDFTKVTFDNFATPVYQAWQTYAVDTFKSSTHADGRTLLPVYQQGSVITSGSMSDINFALGFNVSDKVYIGVGLGLPYLTYHRTIVMQERGSGDTTFYYSTFSNLDDYRLSGFGINGKIGVIVKPTPWMRIGAAVQTPTSFSLTETSHFSTTATYGTQTFGTDTVFNPYSYTFIQPLRATFGASFYLTKWGFVSVDYQLDDYPHSSYRFAEAPSDATYWSTQTGSTYRVASSVKAGAEFSYNVLRVRGGFAWSQSPLRPNPVVGLNDGSRYTATCGVGYRGKVFYADAAYTYNQFKDYYMPYMISSGIQPVAKNSAVYHGLLFTVGLRFGGK